MSLPPKPASMGWTWSVGKKAHFAGTKPSCWRTLTEVLSWDTGSETGRDVRKNHAHMHWSQDYRHKHSRILSHHIPTHRVAAWCSGSNLNSLEAQKTSSAEQKCCHTCMIGPLFLPPPTLHRDSRHYCDLLGFPARCRGIEDPPNPNEFCW